MGCHVGKKFGGLGFWGVFNRMSRATHVCSGRHSSWIRGVREDVYVDSVYVQFDVIACTLNVNIQYI